MFGYVKPYADELLMREFSLYKAIYCGLCRTGGKRISRFSRFLLSYDFTALATLRLALCADGVSVEKRVCPFKLRRCPTAECEEVFPYVAAAFACLTYCKAQDDAVDEKGIKRLFYKMRLPFAKRMKKKADKLYPALYAEVAAPLARLSEMEADGKHHTLDAFADAAAECLGIIASFGLDGDAKAIAFEAGYHIGRYIYIIDAVDDLEKDTKKNRFNPLILHFGTAKAALDALDAVEETLLVSSVRFSAAVGLLEGNAYTDILQNIAIFGMKSVINNIYVKYAYKRKEIEEQ